MKRVWLSKDFNISNYNIPKNICSDDWHYLFNDLKDEYAKYRGWDNEEYWYEDNDKLYSAESAAYEVMSEIIEMFETRE